MRHNLLEKNLDALTGLCQACGPVELHHRKDKDVYQCLNARRAQRNSRPGRNKLKFPDGHPRPSNDEIAAMQVAQGNRCKLCDEFMMEPMVDHCHDTGRVRGILCRKCNVGLGMFNDDPEMLRKAIAYIS